MATAIGCWCSKSTKSTYQQSRGDSSGLVLADALAFVVQVVPGDGRAAYHGVGMVKEGGEGFVTDLVGAPGMAVADEGGDNGPFR